MNLPVARADASDIAAVVERARALLDDGDVMAARILAAGAYDQAKAAAGFAERVNAADRLVDKARRLQGEALLIEARAKVRIADEYDAAQERGEVGQRRGRPKKVVSADDDIPPSAEEVGLSRQEIYDARKLRDAEREQPGIVERAINARLEARLEPSKASLRAAIGTRTATNEERGDNLYETGGEAVSTLLALESFGPLVWEPACGRGAISRRLEDAGYEVLLSDLRDRGAATRHGECQEVGDFLETRRAKDGIRGPWRGALAGEPDIVTNPPYGTVLNAFVAHALREHRPRKMALLLNLNFLCGFDDADRNFAMDECRPARIHVFTRRLPMMHRDGWDGPQASSSMNTAWFVWEADNDGRYTGPTIINRVNWKDFEGVAPLAPGARPVTGEADPAAPTGAVELVWSQPYENSRILAKLGEIEVGAVFPAEKGCTWSFWLGTFSGPHKRARTVEAGKAHIEKLFREKTGLK